MGRELPLHVYLRRGKYLYVEKSGYRPVRLYEQPGTDAFDAEYQAAVAHLPVRKPKRQYIKPTPPKRKAGPSREEISRLVHYFQHTGELFWRDRTPDMFTPTERFSAEAQCSMWNGRHGGEPATFPQRSGYLACTIFGRTYLAHRVIWALVHDEWPESIDHINGDKTDNRLVNLRSATALEQARNCRMRSSNTTGYQGVKQEKSGRWRASIGGGGEAIYLGTFATKDEAIAARKGAEKALGYHENHGRGQTVNVVATSEQASEQPPLFPHEIDLHHYKLLRDKQE
jgi:hypothetical protein